MAANMKGNYPFSSRTGRI